MSEQKQKTLKNHLDIYLRSLGSKDNSQVDELEIRFGTNHKNKITKIKFDNVIEKLYSLGFNMIDKDGKYHLNIANEYVDFKTQKNRTSYIRTEIKGISNISNYCKNDMFDTEDVPAFVSFMSKHRKKTTENEAGLYPIDNKKFEFRVNYKVEKNYNSEGNNYNNNKHIVNILKNWKYSKKTYRFIKRYTMVHPEFPFKFDLSIVKSSKLKYDYNKKFKYLLPTLKIQESDVFNNPENYEIELEMDNVRCDLLKNTINGDLVSFLEAKVKNGIKYILSGLQNTDFPISYEEQKNVLQEYINLVNFKKVEKYVSPRDFIGPSTISLEMKNIIPLKDDISTININNPYSVTEKADGLRKLLYINKKGKVYFINQQMEVQFTGTFTQEEEIFNTLIDGEHVLYNKKHNYINRFLCFDIYISSGVDRRMLPLFKINSKNETDNKKKSKDYRMRYLESCLKKLKLNSVTKSHTDLKITKKRFLTNQDQSIFKCCKEIITQINDGLFEYETDGLIFTPLYHSVGSDKLGKSYNYKTKKYVDWDPELENKKKTWTQSFKWKPPEFNTIDFLVKTKKAENGKDLVQNKYVEGINTTNLTNIRQYKTLILNVGFDEKTHGYINACDDMINYDVYKKNEINNYRPMPFYPSSFPTPYPIYAANVNLKTEGNNKFLLTENGEESFEDDTIVEFRFESSNPQYWQWVPIRVRYDKTTEYKNGRKNYGNAYNVAESVWRSINNPITEDIITGKKEPGSIDDNLYYNRENSKTNTSGLRDFHNKYIKRKLIMAVSRPGDTLIDMTVGKAGDLHKWTQAKLSFVLGMDINKDNIENRLDGACARWLSQKSQIDNIPDALFIQGDAGADLISGQCCKSEKAKEIINAIMGKGPKDEEFLGKGVYNQYAVAEKGFDIVSNQFSIHYMFGEKSVFLRFIKNVADVCKLGGNFIGGCYDGKRIFRDLKNKNVDESIVINQNGTKIWEIIKKYSNDTFEDNETSLGYKIEVYQESINKTFGEYLVNFNYLTRVMESFGFIKLNTKESKKIGFPSSVNSFQKLHNSMKYEVDNGILKKNKLGNALNITPEEKKISFYNNYFIYRKIRNVDSEEVYNALMNYNTLDTGTLEKYENIINNIEGEKASTGDKQGDNDKTDVEGKDHTEDEKNKKKKKKEKKEKKKKRKIPKIKITLNQDTDNDTTQ
jgi:hypothetical protein